MVDDAETQKLLHSPWSTMLKHRSCYTVHGHDAETQKLLHSPWSTMLKHRKLLHSLWSTMLKHKGSRYTVQCGQQQLTQIDYNSHREPSINHRCYLRSAETVRAQISWLKQPAICDAETTCNNSNKNCYSSRNNNTSFSTCNSILLRRLGHPIPV
jgi:hypothetical protein